MCMVGYVVGVGVDVFGVGARSVVYMCRVYDGVGVIGGFALWVGVGWCDGVYMCRLG